MLKISFLLLFPLIEFLLQYTTNTSRSMSTRPTSYEDDEKRSESLDLGAGLGKTDSEIEQEGATIMQVDDAAALGLKTAPDGKVSPG